MPPDLVHWLLELVGLAKLVMLEKLVKLEVPLVAAVLLPMFELEAEPEGTPGLLMQN